MDWVNEPEDIKSYEGFVYLITNNLTGQYYVGKKSFWKRRTLKPLKGKKRKRHVVVESDWRDYWGSSPNLLRDVELLGKENFTREIISCYGSKWELSYYEAKEQFDREVLFDPLSYNQIINLRVRRRK